MENEITFEEFLSGAEWNIELLSKNSKRVITENPSLNYHVFGEIYNRSSDVPHIVCKKVIAVKIVNDLNSEKDKLEITFHDEVTVYKNRILSIEDEAISYAYWEED